MPVKHYKPGDPEFELIKSQITPIERVRKEAFPKTAIYEQPARKIGIGRRRESVDDHRG